MKDIQRLIKHQDQLISLRNFIQVDYNSDKTLVNKAKLRIINEEIAELGNWIRELNEQEDK